MTTHSIHRQSPDRDLERDAHRIGRRRRSAATLAPGGDRAAARSTDAPNRPDATPQPGGARVLRRWSVTDLIARAGGAPRAFA